jgi:hypothetical protein
MPRQFSVNADTLQAIDIDPSELQEAEAALPEAATRGMVPQSTEQGDPSASEQWPGMNPAEKARAVLKWGGNAIASMAGMGTAGYDAVENPATTLAGAAVGGGLRAAAPKIPIPTRAKAGAKFEQVMSKVGDQPVDVGRTGDAALKIADLAQHGGGTNWGPAPVRQLIQYVTDPKKPPLTYKVAREFYSNISRMSADEMKRLPPVMKKELGALRAELDKALADTAGRGGQGQVYRDAMREYAVASRIREFAEKAAKWGAGVAGAGAAYNFMKD